MITCPHCKNYIHYTPVRDYLAGETKCGRCSDMIPLKKKEVGDLLENLIDRVEELEERSRGLPVAYDDE